MTVATAKEHAMAKIRLIPGPRLVCAGCLAEYDPRSESGETGGAKIVNFAGRHRRCREQPRLPAPTVPRSAR